MPFSSGSIGFVPLLPAVLLEETVGFLATTVIFKPHKVAKKFTFIAPLRKRSYLEPSGPRVDSKPTINTRDRALGHDALTRVPRVDAGDLVASLTP
jgi:hypothetical protein